MWTRTPQYMVTDMVTVSCFLLNMCVFFLGSSSVGRLSYKLVFFPLWDSGKFPGLRWELVSPGLNIGFQVDVPTWIYGDLLGQISARQKFRRENTEARRVFTRSLVRNARLDFFFVLDGFLSVVVFLLLGPFIWQDCLLWKHSFFKLT